MNRPTATADPWASTPATPAAQSSGDDFDSMLAGGGGAPGLSFKDAPIGTVQGGVIVAKELRQKIDDDMQPQFWKDGKPIQQFVLTVQTDQRDPSNPEDTGERRMFIKAWGDQKRNLAAAVKAAGAERLEIGGTLLQRFVSEIPAESKMKSPTKVYEFHYTPPQPGAEVDQALGVASTPAPPAAPTNPAPAAPAAQPDPQAALAGMSPEQVARLVAVAQQQNAGAGAAQPPF